MAAPVPGLMPAARDDAYIISRHTSQGKEVLRDLSRGRAVHVFSDDVDLQALEQQVWRWGSFQGRIGSGQRSAFDRFVWRSGTPIGQRIESGKPPLPLYWVEIKGRIISGVWVYHLVPRTRPAS